MPAAIVGLALLAALWSVAPHAAASSHCASQASAALIRDCRTLIDLKDALDPNDNLNWSETLAMEHWEGIRSSQDRGVRTVEIYPTMGGYTDNNPMTLGGTVPTGLGSLPSLRFLKLWRVGLTGSIPAELGNLSNLEELRLDQNSLTGSIPTGLGSLSNLRYLSFSINQLSGGIPSDFGSLSSLEYLSVDRNFLGLQTRPTDGNPPPATVSNPIPSSLGNLSALKGLVLDDNNFSGSIPSALGNLRELTALSLSSNNFENSIPASFGSLTKLESLNAWGNQLSGSIPSQFGNLTALKTLDLAFNGLQNSIPSSLGSLSNLEELLLNENQLRGAIPSQLGNLAKLRRLVLNSNLLNGSIPTALGSLTNLTELNLARNELSGAIPSELGNLLNLQHLSLDDNGLSEGIPAELGNMSTSTDDDNKPLDYINLSCNLLTGNAPSELGDLPNLRVLLIDNNKLNTEAANRPASFSSIGYVRWSSDTECPRGQPDAEPPSSDNVPPTFEKAELSRDGLTVVLTYNESLDSSNAPFTTDFTVKVDGAEVTVSTVSVRIREVRLALGGAVTEHQGVTVAYTDPTDADDANAIQDRAGNDAADLEETTVTNDSTVEDDVAPTFSSASLSTDGTTITLTYSEILKSDAGPRATDFTVKVEGETRDVASVRISGRDVQLRLSSPVTVRQTVVVSYFDPTTGDDDNAIQDRAGNDAANLIDHEITNTSTAQDNRAPVFSRAALSTDGLSITLVYDEVLDDDAGPATSDFSVDVDGDSAEPSQVELSGRTVVLTLATAVKALQDVAVSYTDPTAGDDANAIQDVAGNDSANLVNQVVTNASTVRDEVAPVFQSAATSSDGTKVILTYDEVLDSAKPPATADFALEVQGESRGASNVAVTGKTVELTLGRAITDEQSVNVSYTDPTAGIDDDNAIQDRSGNDADNLYRWEVSNASTVKDETAPKFVRAAMSSNGGVITLIYDEVLDSTNEPTTSDFAITVDEDSSAPSSVYVTGRTVELSLGSSVHSLQTVTVSYTDPTAADDADAVQDPSGNDAASLVNHPVTNASTVLDSLPPLFQSAATSSDGAKIIMTYDEVLDSENAPATADFELEVRGERRDVSAVTVTGKTVELTLGSAITTGQPVYVTYNDPTDDVDDTNAIQDRAGNDASDVTYAEVTNSSGTLDDTAPTFVRAALSSDGSTITLTYNEVLDGTNQPATTDFAVTVAEQSAGLSSINVEGRNVLLYLNDIVTAGQAVRVSYTDPTADTDDANAIQDPAGNDAANLVNQTVVNASTVPDGTPPEFQSVAMSTDGLTITLTYDETLDSSKGPVAANFAITVQGERRDVSTVNVNGLTVALGLGTAITSDESVTVTYTDPTADVDDTRAIQDLAGNDAANLSESVTNASTVVDATPPSFLRAALSSDGGTITLTYDEVLDDTHTPSTSDFTVTVDGAEATITSLTVRGRTAILILESTVRADQDVKLSYTDPTPDTNDIYAIQDPAGNDAASLVNEAVTNSSTVVDERPPEFQSVSMSTDGLTITLTYDEDLDGRNKPRVSDFSLTVQGERRDVATVTVSGMTVALGLDTAITTGLSVAVTYTDPTPNVNDTNAIQDTAGNDAANLTEPVTNTSEVADEDAPTLVTAETSTDGGRIILTFSEVLDANSVPAADDFAVKVDDQEVDLVSVSPVTIRGRTVVLGLDAAVTAGQDITVSYTDLTDGNDEGGLQDPAGNDVETITDETVTNRVGQRPSRPTTPESPSTPGTPGATPSGTSTPGTPSTDTQVWLDLTLTVPEGPAAVGQTLAYTVTVSNTGTQPLTGVTWRETTADPDAASQSLGNLAAGASTNVQGSFGPLRADHMPHIILTVRANSDQTEERVASQQVEVVAALTESQQQSTVDLSGQQPGLAPALPRVPSRLVLRVVRVRYEVPDMHLAHNIPDLLLTLPDGSETTCNFLTHYDSTGGLTRWGYTTSEVLEERPGFLTQYYQRGVVDCHERDGVWLMERRLAWDHFGGGIDGSEDLGFEPNLLSDQPGQLQGPWGHRVSDYAVDGRYTGFLSFFTRLGGVPSFGYPKTEARYDNDPRRELGIAAATEGFIRQYFQAAVMEFHPETLAPVMLRLLGDDLRDRRYPNESYKLYTSFASVPPLQVGQIFVVEDVTANPVTAPPLGTPVTSPPPPPSPARPSARAIRVDRVQFSAPDGHLAHNIPDLILELPDGSEQRCDFLSYYESTQGLARWGHAISEVLEEYPGTLTQYYQGGVVDCQETDDGRLLERRLAWDFIGGGAEGAPDLGVEPHLLSDQPGELHGPWGHRVSDYAVDGTYTGFLDFFTALGGVNSFGNPKTEARYDDDTRAVLSIAGTDSAVIRQYFQAAVLEFHPNDSAQPVKVYLLGHDVRDRLYPNRLHTTIASFGPATALSEGQFYAPERLRLAAVTAPSRPSATSPGPSLAPRLGLRVGRVLHSSPDRHLSHNIPDLTLTLADGGEHQCDFLSYYEATNGIERWGHAISEVLVEQPGTLTQYYQRGVVDCHVRDGQYLVERRLAWDYLGGGMEGAPDLGVEPDLLSEQPGESLGPWGHVVSNYAVDGTHIGFLDFFTAMGGVEAFGYPKTEARYDNDPRAVLRIPNAAPGVIRQYFQAAVLEYHPEDQVQPVKIYLLGHELRDGRYPALRAFVAFGPFGPLTQGQSYFPITTSNVIRPAG